jgi:hypothetical protein
MPSWVARTTQPASAKNSGACANSPTPISPKPNAVHLNRATSTAVEAQSTSRRLHAHIGFQDPGAFMGRDPKRTLLTASQNAIRHRPKLHGCLTAWCRPQQSSTQRHDHLSDNRHTQVYSGVRSAYVGNSSWLSWLSSKSTLSLRGTWSSTSIALSAGWSDLGGSTPFCSINVRSSAIRLLILASINPR